MLRRAALLVCLLLVPPTAWAVRKGRVLKLRLPPTTIEPGESTEGCAAFRIPGDTPFDLGGWEMRNKARGVTVLHTIAYLYRGERLGEFAAEAGRVVLSKGCLDLGPVDRDRRQMFAAITSTSGKGLLPPGVALRLSPVPAVPGGLPDGIGILLDVNWQNVGTKPRRASARLFLRRAKRGTVSRLALPFADRGAERGLDVPPFAVRSTEDSTAALNAARPGEPPERDAWVPAADACVFTLAPQMHKRGRFFAADLLDATGSVRNPPPVVADPFDGSRTHLYGALDYTDPGLRIFAPSLLVHAGESIHYLCWHDNGATRALRFGCEESAGVPPGVPVGLGTGAAKLCTTPGPGSPDCPASDPAYPGRTFTGACVAANLVAGTTPEDEVCGVTGLYYDAVPGAAAGAECDARALPPVE